jgi:hypothetical protein
VLISKAAERQGNKFSQLIYPQECQPDPNPDPYLLPIANHCLFHIVHHKSYECVYMYYREPLTPQYCNSCLSQLVYNSLIKYCVPAPHCAYTCQVCRVSMHVIEVWEVNELRFHPFVCVCLPCSQAHSQLSVLCSERLHAWK